MSFGAPVLAVFTFLRNQGYLEGIRHVAELGSMEYESKAPETDTYFERFFTTGGKPVPEGRNPENGMRKGWAKEFYNCLGFDYVSFDIDGRFGSQVFDLNHDKVPPELFQWSDLTCNLGTSEHVFNQVNCFEVMHNLTKPGGLLLQLLPMNNYPNHGLYQYNPSTFFSVAEFNDYEVLGQWVSTPDPAFWMPANVGKKFLRAVGPANVTTLMRKRSHSDFVMPLQIDTPMHVHDSALARYNAESFQTHASAIPAFGSGFEVDFETMQVRGVTLEEMMADERLRLLMMGGADSPSGQLRTTQLELRRRDKQLARLQAELAELKEKVGA